MPGHRSWFQRTGKTMTSQTVTPKVLNYGCPFVTSRLTSPLIARLSNLQTKILEIVSCSAARWLHCVDMVCVYSWATAISDRHRVADTVFFFMKANIELGVQDLVASISFEINNQNSNYPDIHTAPLLIITIGNQLLSSIIAIAGTNDLEAGSQNNIFRHLVIVSTLPHRHDLPGKETELVNAYIEELCARHSGAVVLDFNLIRRGAFTRHDMHLRTKSKRLLARHLVECMQELGHIPDAAPSLPPQSPTDNPLPAGSLRRLT
ncbi:hypothetical protein J6590_070274 [Homalodisca vitripennis]|nr:hypothetical protein J6590_070274 [Homalodisca vitripennis]